MVARRMSFEEKVVLALLALLPVAFTRITADVFEVPRTAILATSVLFLAWRRLAFGVDAMRLGITGLSRDPLGASIVLFLVSALVSTLLSPNPEQSLHGTPDSTAGLVTALSTAAIYFTSRAVGGEAASLVRYARAIGIASLLAAVYALLQLAGLDPIAWNRLATFEGRSRVFGTMGHPNLLGAYLAMAVPLTAWLALRARNAMTRAAWAVIGAIDLAVVVATLSRGAWIAVVGAGAAGAALLIRARSSAPDPLESLEERRRVRFPAAATISIALLAVAAILLFRAPIGRDIGTRVRQIASLSAPTTQSRIYMWRAGLRMAHDHPLFGVGLDAFGSAFPRYNTAGFWQVEWGVTPTKAHSEPIQILATQGVFGGIAALLVLFFAARCIWQRTGSGGADARRGAAAAGATLAAFVTQGLTGFTVVPLGVLAAVLAGWLSTESLGAREDPAEHESRLHTERLRPWIPVIAAIPFALLLAYLVAFPVAAQFWERRAMRAPSGSHEQVHAYQRAAGYAPWDSRYEDSQAWGLLEQSDQESDPSVRREILRRARKAENQAIQADERNGVYYANLAAIERAQAQLNPPEASALQIRNSFLRAIAYDPVNAQVMDQAGYALLEQGDLAAARSIAMRSATLYPDLGQPMAFLGALALLQGRWRDGVDTLQISVSRQWRGEKAAQANAWNNLSAAYLAGRRPEEALHAAENALRLDPGNPEATQRRMVATEWLRRSVPSPSGRP